MSEHVSPPLVLVPETAPFSADQRSWLSGYFAALLGPAVEGATALGTGEMPGGPQLADNGDAPWHDPSLPLAEPPEDQSGLYRGSRESAQRYNTPSRATM